MVPIRLLLILTLMFQAFSADADDVAPSKGAVVRVDPKELAPTQVEYGADEVTYDLKHWAKDKTAKDFEEYVRTKVTKVVPGFYGPPLSAKAGAKSVVYINDGHHHAAALDRLLHDYDSLPDDVKALVSRETQKAWRSDPRFLMQVEIKEVYSTPDEILVAFAKQGNAGLPEAVAEKPEFAAAFKRVAEAKAPSAADLAILRKAYATLPPTVEGLKDSPLRSVMGIFFHKHELKGGYFVDRIQFRLADKLKASGFVIETNPEKIKESLKQLEKAVFGDPEILKFLKANSRPGFAEKNAEQLKKAEEEFLAAEKGVKDADHLDIPKLLKVICNKPG